MKPLDKLKEMALNDQKKRYPNVPPHALSVPKYNPKTSNGLTKCIKDFLKLSGWQAERINTTGMPVDTRRNVTDVIGRTKTIGSITWRKGTGTKGSADLSATIKGRSVKIEVKAGSDRQSKAQKEYQQQVEDSGGIYLIAKDFDQFYHWYIGFIDLDI